MSNKLVQSQPHGFGFLIDDILSMSKSADAGCDADAAASSDDVDFIDTTSDTSSKRDTTTEQDEGKCLLLGHLFILVIKRSAFFNLCMCVCARTHCATCTSLIDAEHDALES